MYFIDVGLQKKKNGFIYKPDFFFIWNCGRFQGYGLWIQTKKKNMIIVIIVSTVAEFRVMFF